MGRTQWHLPLPDQWFGRLLQQKIADSFWHYETHDYHAAVDGPLTGELPVPETLSLAEGYHIMTLWNSPQYKNGLLDTIVKLNSKSIRVRLDTGKEVTILLSGSSGSKTKKAWYRLGSSP